MRTDAERPADRRRGGTGDVGGVPLHVVGLPAFSALEHGRGRDPRPSGTRRIGGHRLAADAGLLWTLSAVRTVGLNGGLDQHYLVCAPGPHPARGPLGPTPAACQRSLRSRRCLLATGRLE